jgi:hypothetical protein
MRIPTFLLVCLFLVRCTERPADQEIYELLNVCLDDFYQQKGIDIQQELTAFENQLLAEGHLQRKGQQSDFKTLLEFLSENTYFSPPLKKDDFNSTLLLENPTRLVECLNYSFNIDSLELMELSYYQATAEIGKIIEVNEEVAIHDIFATYAAIIAAEDFNQPFVRESLLMLLYRWYYKSKYDREIILEE